MDGFMFFFAIPAVVSVRDAAVIDKARGGVDATDGRPGSTRQSIRLEDAAEWVLPRKVVVKRQELALRRFGHGFQLLHEDRFQLFA